MRDAQSFVIKLQLLVKQTAKSSMKMIAAYLPTGVCAAPVAYKKPRVKRQTDVPVPPTIQIFRRPTFSM